MQCNAIYNTIRYKQKDPENVQLRSKQEHFLQRLVALLPDHPLASPDNRVAKACLPPSLPPSLCFAILFTPRSVCCVVLWWGQAVEAWRAVLEHADNNYVKYLSVMCDPLSSRDELTVAKVSCPVLSYPILSCSSPLPLFNTLNAIQYDTTRYNTIQ